MTRLATARLNLETLEARVVPARVSYDSSTLVLTVKGTEGNDTVSVSSAGASLHVYISGYGTYKAPSSLRKLVFDGRGGDDVFRNRYCPSLFYGGAGNDRFEGGWFYGEAHGGAGNDTLIGGERVDRLYGQGGVDWLEGRGGNDYLDGGRDGLTDTLIGGAGDDVFVRHIVLSLTGVRREYEDVRDYYYTANQADTIRWLIGWGTV